MAVYINIKMDETTTACNWCNPSFISFDLSSDISVSQPPYTSHNTSPKCKEHKQGENAIIYLQANKTHTGITSVQDQEDAQRNTSLEQTRLHTTTSRQNIRKPFI
jgi:hypothetical protein